ncbi:unnamed protein product [Heligmosomoides polygyrus]|uniref:Uncharacterized protein n=1 Tax=Heligmosomoides polygyrus TaxID=6339 RepID=A0A183FXI4_HELPZ|nr:unnamed protein product [Heligmosomoides polygyrus]
MRSSGVGQGWKGREWGRAGTTHEAGRAREGSGYLRSTGDGAAVCDWAPRFLTYTAGVPGEQSNMVVGRERKPDEAREVVEVEEVEAVVVGESAVIAGFLWRWPQISPLIGRR